MVVGASVRVCMCVGTNECVCLFVCVCMFVFVLKAINDFYSLKDF